MTTVGAIIERVSGTGWLRKLRTMSGPIRKQMARFLWPHPDHQLLLFRECSMFGKGTPSLTEMQRALIGAMFETRWHHWRSGKTPPPPKADVYSASVTTSVPSVAVVMSRYVYGDPAFIDYDVAYHFSRSAEEAGIRVHRFDADSLVWGRNGDLATSLESLRQFLAKTEPAIVAFDGNFIPNGRTIDANAILDLKRLYGFKLLSVIGDCYDAQPRDFLGYWHGVADMSVIFHEYTKYYRNLPNKSNVLVCPTLPFHETTFAPGAARDIDLSFIGSDQRDRRLFLRAAADAGLKTLGRFHNRARSEAPDLTEYVSLLGRSKLTFNNGWVHNGDSIITGRVGEAILSGAVLIQEVGTPIDDYLVPFVHYVPVANLVQLVVFCQFLIENDELRARISNEARIFWQARYASSRFWQRIAQGMR